YLNNSFVATATNHRRHWGRFREVITQHIYWEHFLLGTNDLIAILNGSFSLTPWEVLCKLKSPLGRKRLFFIKGRKRKT
ncbi:Spermatogenesis-associated protein 17, partial [Clarias magur]